MHFNGPIVRPPTDADSVFIEVTVGCTHNSCTFCNFYEGYPFRVAPWEQIEADVKEAALHFPRPRKSGLRRQPLRLKHGQTYRFGRALQSISRTAASRPMPVSTTCTTRASTI